MISAITSCRDNPIFNMEIKNYETPGNKEKFLCENILKHIATPKFKEVCGNRMHKIFEILKKVN